MSSSPPPPPPPPPHQQLPPLPPNTCLSFIKKKFDALAIEVASKDQPYVEDMKRHYISAADRQMYNCVFTIPINGLHPQEDFVNLRKTAIPTAEVPTNPACLSPNTTDALIADHEKRQQNLLYLFVTTEGRPIESCKLFQHTLYAFDSIVIEASLLVETDQTKVNEQLFKTYASEKRFRDPSKKKSLCNYTTNWTVIEELVWMLCSVGNDRRQRSPGSGPLRLAIVYDNDDVLRQKTERLLMQDKYQKMFSLFNVECKKETCFFKDCFDFVTNWKNTSREFYQQQNQQGTSQSQSQNPPTANPLSNPSNNIKNIGNLNSSAVVSVLNGTIEGVLSATSISDCRHGDGVFVRIISTSNNNQDHIRPNQCIVLYPNEVGMVKRIVAIYQPLIYLYFYNSTSGNACQDVQLPRASAGQLVFLRLADHEEYGHGGIRSSPHGLKTSPSLAFVGSDDYFTPRNQLANGSDVENHHKVSNSTSSLLEVPVSAGVNPPDFSYQTLEKKRVESKYGFKSVEWATVSDPNTPIRQFADRLSSVSSSSSSPIKSPIEAEIPSAAPLKCYDAPTAASFFDHQNDRRSFATVAPLFASMIRLSDICPEVLSHDSTASTLRDSLHSLRRLFATNLDSLPDDKLKRSREQEEKISSSIVGESFVCGPHGMSIATTVLRRTFDGYSEPQVPKGQGVDDVNDKTGKPSVFDMTLRPASNDYFGPLMLTQEQEDQINRSYHSNFFGRKFKQPGTGDELKMFLQTHPLVLVVHCSPNKGELGLVIEPFILLRVCSASTFASGVISCLENKPAISPKMMMNSKTSTTTTTTTTVPSSASSPSSTSRNDDDHLNNTSATTKFDKHSIECPECCRSFASLDDIFPELFLLCSVPQHATSKQMMELRLTLIQVLLGDISPWLQYDRGIRCRLVDLMQRAKYAKVNDATGDVTEKSVLLRKSTSSLLSPSTDVSITHRTLASLLSCVSCETCSDLWLYELLVLGSTDRFKLTDSLGIEPYNSSSRAQGNPSLYHRVAPSSYTKMMPFHLKKLYLCTYTQQAVYEKFLLNSDMQHYINPFTFSLFSTVLNRRAVDCLVTKEARQTNFKTINEYEHTFHATGLCLTSPTDSVIPDLVAARCGNGVALRRLIILRSRYYDEVLHVRRNQQTHHLPGADEFAIRMMQEIGTVLADVVAGFGFASYSAIDTLLKWEVATNAKDLTLAELVDKYCCCERVKTVYHVVTNEFAFGSAGRDFAATLMRRLYWVKSFGRLPLVQDLSNNPTQGACLYLRGGSATTSASSFPSVRTQPIAYAAMFSAPNNAAATASIRPVFTNVTNTRNVNPKDGNRIADSIGKFWMYHWIGTRFQRYDEAKKNEIMLQKLASHFPDQTQIDYSGNALIVVFTVMSFLMPVVVTRGGSVDFSISESVLFGM